MQIRPNNDAPHSPMNDYDFCLAIVTRPPTLRALGESKVTIEAVYNGCEESQCIRVSQADLGVPMLAERR
jgi:hypothetical protein